ncbi:hypothetical protein KZP23_07515 [Echinicola marina]|uniref:hypothetical protein n=1 Tax=Echinicola marina TaxID=2859768 RepID=UPI001CF6D457|nr:hypothetical protein [Echinicola marina]UCS94848.1 hypothetical protein KZP23_07515 [Echinicola marina]
MKIIEPYSEELRELKEKAIVNMDKPLLNDLRKVEGEKFIYCETFFDALQATSIENNALLLIESTELKELLRKAKAGEL